MKDPFNTNTAFMREHGPRIRRIRRARARLVKSFIKRGYSGGKAHAIFVCPEQCFMVAGHFHVNFRGLRLLWIAAYRNGET